MDTLPITTPRQAGIYVRQARETQGLTRATLAKKAGVSARLLASLCAALADMHPSRCRCRRSTALRPACSPAGHNKRPRLRSRVKGRTARQPVLCRSISAMLKTAGPSMPGTLRARAWKISLIWRPPPWPAIYTPAIYRASGRASRRENVICRSSRCSTIMRISRA